MKLIADFHIHSHFSIATSKQLVPEFLDLWARIKGINIVGTGDFTHPGWLSELKEKLVPAEQGLYQLKKTFTHAANMQHKALSENNVRFLLTAEISNIYKRDGKTRKVHNLLFAPDFDTVEKIQRKLDQIGNIISDGRPILGLDSRDLLEICLTISDDIMLVPAHIWTPWFSALGSKSGFDSIEQAYADLSPHITAVETGLSADPPMHWMCSHLDKYAIMSNSDAHSPEKLGREANILDTELSYAAITGAYKQNDTKRLLGTIEFFPQEGKYHYDGHRKCKVCWNPVQTLKNSAICTECGKPVTVGVMNRAAALSDRQSPDEAPYKIPFTSMIPLKELISEIEGVGVNSQKVARRYNQVIEKLGPELQILLWTPLQHISLHAGECTAEAVRRVRKRQVFIQEGYDGEFGRITVFHPSEKTGKTQSSLFIQTDTNAPPQKAQRLSFDLSEYRHVFEQAVSEQESAAAEHVKESRTLFTLNAMQKSAASHQFGPALVVSGPGTGKTRVLVCRITHLLASGKAKPENILAVTFTNKAANEIAGRVKMALNAFSDRNLMTVTFHELGWHILTTSGNRSQIDLIDENDRIGIICDVLGYEKRAAKQLSKKIGGIKQQLLIENEIKDPYDREAFRAYQSFLGSQKLYDLDDLIYHAVLFLRNNEEKLEALRQKWQWILIDEYQDVNYAQYALVRLLANEKRSNIMAIGDPDQAIYGFRGSDKKYIDRFLADYPESAVYVLTESYRCSGNILKASSQMLHKKRGRPNALAGLRQGLQVGITHHQSDSAEAEFIARTIESMFGGLRFFSMDSGITTGNEMEDIQSLSDFAVLCRTHRQMETIEQAFNNHAIPYQTIGEKPFFKLEPYKTVLDLLRFLFLGGNDYLKSNLEKRIMKPPESFKCPQIDKANLSEAVLILQDMIFPSIDEKTNPLWERLAGLAKKYNQNPEDFFRLIKLGKGQDAFEFETEKTAVMTLHAAKGLEFPCVFIAGCEEGLIPYTFFKKAVDSEEERRLLYVGMTRAKLFLYLSHADKRMIMGRYSNQKPSRFLSDIEEELLYKTRHEITRKQDRKDNQMKLF